MIRLKTESAEETVKTGYCLGSILGRSDLVCLEGGLGSGKTSFTKGLAKALGFEGYVTSPTFTVMNLYDGGIPVYHFDVYRLADAEELYNIGFEDYVDAVGVTVVEWADLAGDALPAERITVRFGFGADEIAAETEAEAENKAQAQAPDTRCITISFEGRRYEHYNENMRKSLLKYSGT